MKAYLPLAIFLWDVFYTRTLALCIDVTLGRECTSTTGHSERMQNPPLEVCKALLDQAALIWWQQQFCSKRKAWLADL